MLSKFTNSAGGELWLDMDSIEFVLSRNRGYQIHLKSGDALSIDGTTYDQIIDILNQGHDMPDVDDEPVSGDPDKW